MWQYIRANLGKDSNNEVATKNHRLLQNYLCYLESSRAHRVSAPRLVEQGS